MNKKEISEIKKQFKPEQCTITRICGCYIDGEKTIKTEWKEAFLSLPEDEAFKYFTIFKQTLSGTIGKNLLNLDFPLEQEQEGGTQQFLLKLRDSRLKDQTLIDEFYKKIIESYQYGEHYYIILIHAAYDIPGKASDGTRMFDASDDVFEYILCSICPVHLSKPGLCYNTETNVIENRTQDWIVEAPAKGFLFPAFNDRYTDIHSTLYYSKNPEDLQPEFTSSLFGSVLPATAKIQKEMFNAIVADTLGEDCDYTVIKNIHENLNEMLEESKDAPEPLVLSKPEVKHLLEYSGVPEEKLETFEEHFDSVADEKTVFVASNIASQKNSAWKLLKSIFRLPLNTQI